MKVGDVVRFTGVYTNRTGCACTIVEELPSNEVRVEFDDGLLLNTTWGRLSELSKDYPPYLDRPKNVMKFKIGDKVRCTKKTEKGGFEFGTIVGIGFDGAYHIADKRDGTELKMPEECLELVREGQQVSDSVNHPSHYCNDPSGIECIDMVKYRDFCVGNAIKYLWRAGLKHDADKSDKEKEIEDLKKAEWYICKKIDMLESNSI